MIIINLALQMKFVLIKKGIEKYSNSNFDKRYSFSLIGSVHMIESHLSISLVFNMIY